MSQIMMPIKTTLAITLTASLLATVGVAQKHWEFQDFIKTADVAFHGRVTAIRNEAMPAKKMAFTHVTFAIDRVLFDRTETKIAKQIKLVFAGGTYADKRVRVSGVPGFELGDEVVVFTQHTGIRYATPILGGEQGVLRVLRDSANKTAYPLLSGSRGIAAIRGGSFESADALRAIRDGQITWRPADPQLSEHIIGPPKPVTGTAAVSASPSKALEPVRPKQVVTLAGLFDAVVKLDKLVMRTRQHARSAKQAAVKPVQERKDH